MKRGCHIHLPFGEGDMDVPAVLQALSGIGFASWSASSFHAKATVPIS